MGPLAGLLALAAATAVVRAQGGVATPTPAQSPLNPLRYASALSNNTARDPCSGALTNLIAFGPSVGDAAVAPNDDDFVGPLSLAGRPVRMFSRDYASVYLSNNGLISMVAGIGEYVPLPFPLVRTPANPVVAALWADVDTRTAVPGTVGNGLTRNTVYYRYGTAPSAADASRLAADVAASFPLEPAFNAGSAVIATWFATGYFANKVDLLNTFQIAIAADTSGRTFAWLCYDTLLWLVGSASNNQNPNAGFDAGDGRNFYSLPGSFTAAARDFTCAARLQPRPGCFVFRIDGSSVVAPSATATGTTTGTGTWSGSRSGTPTTSPSGGPVSASGTPSGTVPPSASPSASPSPSSEPTDSPTPSGTRSGSGSVSATPSGSGSPSPTGTAEPTASASPTPTGSATASDTGSPTASSTPTPSASGSPSDSATGTHTPTASATATLVPASRFVPAWPQGGYSPGRTGRSALFPGPGGGADGGRALVPAVAWAHAASAATAAARARRRLLAGAAALLRGRLARSYRRLDRALVGAAVNGSGSGGVGGSGAVTLPPVLGSPVVDARGRVVVATAAGMATFAVDGGHAVWYAPHPFLLPAAGGGGGGVSVTSACPVVSPTGDVMVAVGLADASSAAAAATARLVLRSLDASTGAQLWTASSTLLTASAAASAAGASGGSAAAAAAATAVGCPLRDPSGGILLYVPVGGDAPGVAAVHSATGRREWDWRGVPPSTGGGGVAVVPPPLVAAAALPPSSGGGSGGVRAVIAALACSDGSSGGGDAMSLSLLDAATGWSLWSAPLSALPLASATAAAGTLSLLPTDVLTGGAGCPTAAHLVNATPDALRLYVTWRSGVTAAVAIPRTTGGGGSGSVSAELSWWTRLPAVAAAGGAPPASAASAVASDGGVVIVAAYPAARTLQAVAYGANDTAGSSDSAALVAKWRVTQTLAAMAADAVVSVATDVGGTVFTWVAASGAGNNNSSSGSTATLVALNGTTGALLFTFQPLTAGTAPSGATLAAAAAAGGATGPVVAADGVVVVTAGGAVAAVVEAPVLVAAAAAAPVSLAAVAAGAAVGVVALLAAGCCAAFLIAGARRRKRKAAAAAAMKGVEAPGSATARRSTVSSLTGSVTASMRRLAATDDGAPASAPSGQFGWISEALQLLSQQPEPAPAVMVDPDDGDDDSGGLSVVANPMARLSGRLKQPPLSSRASTRREEFAPTTAGGGGDAGYGNPMMTTAPARLSVPAPAAAPAALPAAAAAASKQLLARAGSSKRGVAEGPKKPLTVPPAQRFDDYEYRYFGQQRVAIRTAPSRGGTSAWGGAWGGLATASTATLASPKRGSKGGSSRNLGGGGGGGSSSGRR